MIAFAHGDCNRAASDFSPHSAESTCRQTTPRFRRRADFSRLGRNEFRPTNGCKGTWGRIVATSSWLLRAAQNRVDRFRRTAGDVGGMRRIRRTPSGAGAADLVSARNAGFAPGSMAAQRPSLCILECGALSPLWRDGDATTAAVCSGCLAASPEPNQPHPAGRRPKR